MRACFYAFSNRFSSLGKLGPIRLYDFVQRRFFRPAPPVSVQRTWVQGPIRWLAADRVDEAREHLSRGLAEWPWPRFDTQRFGAIFEALIDLYAGVWPQCLPRASPNN